MTSESTEALDAKVRIANALGEMPYKQWPVLAAAVKARLAEDAAEIERLRHEVVNGIKNAQMDEVPLPAMSAERETND